VRSKILGLLSVLAILAALYMIFFFAPTEATMGSIQRIFYVHLPSAIVGSFGSAFLLFVGSFMFLISRELEWDRFAACSAELGVLFTATTLATGMIWAKPVWGIWWTWDARLTLEFVLGLIFVAYFMLRAYLPEREKRAKLSAAFGLLGMLDVPINYMSIRWWRGQHPSPVVGPGGGGQDPDMAKTLMVAFLAFTIMYIYLLDRRLAVAKIEEEVEYLEHTALANE
jgi:heme exporter protein C